MLLEVKDHKIILNIFKCLEIYLQKLQFTPNPNGGILNIACAGATNLTIYNLLGNKVVRIPLNPQIALNTIKLEQFNPGLYFIKVENGQNEIFISKLIIQQ